MTKIHKQDHLWWKETKSYKIFRPGEPSSVILFEIHHSFSDSQKTLSYGICVSYFLQYSFEIQNHASLSGIFEYYQRYSLKTQSNFG